jgi:hypothetical protein
MTVSHTMPSSADLAVPRPERSLPQSRRGFSLALTLMSYLPSFSIFFFSSSFISLTFGS